MVENVLAQGLQILYLGLQESHNHCLNKNIDNESNLGIIRYYK